MSDNEQREAERRWYFQGYSDPNAPHPRFAATGTEGRCELCGKWESPQHDAHKALEEKDASS